MPEAATLRLMVEKGAYSPPNTGVWRIDSMGNCETYVRNGEWDSCRQAELGRLEETT